MEVIRNEGLTEYINAHVDSAWAEKDFVKLVKSFLSQEYKKILVIGGLKCTGKTTGVLQALEGLDACYVIPKENEVESAEAYISLLESVSEKYIVIDNYCKIKDREALDAFLNNYVIQDKRIILLGRNLATFEEKNEGSIYHKMEIVDISTMPYDEFCRVNRVSYSMDACEKYLKAGGVFDISLIKTPNEIKSYIHTITESLYPMYGEKSICHEKAEFLVFKILYDAISQNNLSLHSELSSSYLSLEQFLEMMEVEQYGDFSQSELEAVMGSLEKCGLIVQLSGYDSDLKRCYITIPSLMYNLLQMIYKHEVSDSSVLASVYSSSIAVLLSYCHLEEHEVYFVDSKHRNQYFVISDKDREFFYYFECSFAENADSVECGILDSDGDILAYYYVYCGSPCIINHKECEVLCIPMGRMLSRYFECNTNKRFIDMI